MRILSNTFVFKASNWASCNPTMVRNGARLTGDNLDVTLPCSARDFVFDVKWSEGGVRREMVLRDHGVGLRKALGR